MFGNFSMILPRMPIHLSSIQTGLSAQMRKSRSRILVRTRTALGDEFVLICEIRYQSDLSNVCTGMHLADATIFLTCAMSLAVFETKPIIDSAIVEHDIELTSGVIRHR